MKIRNFTTVSLAELSELRGFLGKEVTEKQVSKKFYNYGYYITRSEDSIKLRDFRDAAQCIQTIADNFPEDFPFRSTDSILYKKYEAILKLLFN